MREPVYSLMYTMTSIREGETAFFTLLTENVPAGAIVAYRIEGVDPDDIVGGLLSGRVTVGADGTATIAVPVAADARTEGPESLIVFAEGVRATIRIDDSSTGDTGSVPPSGSVPGSVPDSGPPPTAIAVPIASEGQRAPIVRTDDSLEVTGQDGLDTVQYAVTRDRVSLERDASGGVRVIRDDAIDRLVAVERIQLQDTWIALDLDGNAGVAARMIVAAFGTEALPQYLGIGISLADQGYTTAQLANLVVARALVPQDHRAFVTTVYQNVMGVAPDADDLAFYQGLVDRGLATRESLLALAAELDLSAAQVQTTAIGLVGLPYVPVA